MKILLLQVVGLALIYFASADVLYCERNEIFSGFKGDGRLFVYYSSPLCNYFPQNVCSSTKAKSNLEATDYGDYRLSVACPGSRQVIQRADVDVYDNGQPYSITIYCCNLASTLTASRPYIKDSSTANYKSVDCGTRGAMRNITLDYPGYKDATLATVTCVRLYESD